MKRIHVHIHGGLDYLLPRRTADEQSREPDGRFGAGGSGHALRKHRDEGAARADVAERHAGLESHGFRHERTEPGALGGENHHYAHPDGSRAVIMHGQEALSGRHTVNSVVNTMNRGKKPGANAHKLIDPGFAKNMDPGQRKLSGFPDGKK